MEAISVKVTIEPYDNGKAIVVRSGDLVWWKWYASGGSAGAEAHQLGLADEQVFPTGERNTQEIRFLVKSDAVVDPDELVRFGFEPPALSVLKHMCTGASTFASRAVEK